MKNASKHMRFITTKDAGGAPGDDELALINAYTLREHTADELYSRTMYLAHNGIDRDREVIDPVLLGDLAKTLPGKGFFIKHPMGWDGDSGPGEGRFYKASVVEMSIEEARSVLREPDLKFVDDKAHLLEASFYMVRVDDKLIKKIDAGVAGDVSIGFSSSDATPIKDASDNIIARRLQPPGQAYEGSLVWLGAQPGARVFKQATVKDEDKTMDFEKKFNDAQTEITALKTQIDGHKATETELTTIKTALGDDANDIATLKANAELGKQYHGKLVNDVVAAERTAGLIEGDDDKTVNEAKALYVDWPVDRLQKYLQRVNTMNTKGGQLDGGDPNARDVDTGNQDKADTSNPMNNKAVTG